MKYVLAFMVVVASVLLGMPTQAQDSPPVVYAILFYSPTCPHCHQFITEQLPPIQQQFGDQLQVLFIDVSTEEGANLFRAVIRDLDVPEGQAGYVPTMVIGSKVMVGGTDIPNNMPTLVSNGLAAGGIGVPPVPEIQAAFGISGDGSGPIQTAVGDEPTWQDKFNRDKTGNTLAVAVLLLLVAGLVMQLGGEYQALRDQKPTLWLSWQKRRLLTAGLAGLTAAVVVTLVLHDGEISLPSALALVVVMGLLGVVWRIWQARERSAHATETLLHNLIPIIAVLGMIVAGYLAYIEIREDEAVCGAVGDCNTVQQSDYAKLLGILPIGVMGLIGYVAIIGVWWLGRRPESALAPLAHIAGLGMALGGVVFSIYLTFLEPFVIGATCAWCLTSALLMLLILMLQAPQGWRALKDWLDPQQPARQRGQHHATR